MKNKQEVSYQTAQLFSKLAATVKPKEPLTLSEWADRYMMLPAGSSEPGHYSSKTIPYQKAILDAITDPEVIDVSVMSSAQVGKTTIMMCGIGYYIDYEPSTQMLVIPNLGDGERFSKTRLSQMINDIPELRDKVADVKAKSSNNTIMLKQYPGGSLAIAGANSPKSLASDPRRIIWMDEIDRYPESAGTEGNPIKLAEKRATSFWNRKYIKTSTPTNLGTSKILDAYNKGSMETWSVKCPVCGEYQEYDFQRVQFDDVGMACKFCGTVSKERKWKESEHKWIALHPEIKRRRSFRLNELASPFVDWSHIIETFKDAMERKEKFHDVSDLQVFINTVLGEPWDETEHMEDSVSQNELQKRAEYYGCEIPVGVIILTAAVDVQKDRLELEVRGWAREYESWGIYKTEIYGETIKSDVWDELERYLDQDFTFADGRQLGIAGFAVDTGYQTNTVYRWCKAMKKKGKKCYPVKGYANKAGIDLIHGESIQDVKEEVNGKSVVVDRLVVKILGVDTGKLDITNRLAIEEPGEGYCHFPADDGRGYDEAYYEGLLSEKQVDRKVNGEFRKVWKKKSGARNEPFDLFNYNLATMEMLRPDWDTLEKKVEKGINYTKVTENKKITRRKSYGGMKV